MLISDKSRSKRNVEQIRFQLALKNNNGEQLIPKGLQVKPSGESTICKRPLILMIVP